MRLSLILSVVALLWAGTAFGGFVGFSCNDSDSDFNGCGSHDFGFWGEGPHGFDGCGDGSHGFDGCGGGPEGFGFWGGGRHEFGWGCGPCWGVLGCGAQNWTECREERFEDRYDTLVDKYDTGVAENPDFVGSDQYDHLLKAFQRLVDRHQSFLDRDSDCIDHIGEVIDQTNERIQHYADLIANPPDKIPADCLDKFIERITAKKDRLQTCVDDLTKKQTTLQANYDEYVQFHEEVVTYLDGITGAGGSTSTETALDSVSLSGDGLLSGDFVTAGVTEEMSLPYVVASDLSFLVPDSDCASSVWNDVVMAPAPVPEPSMVVAATSGILLAFGFAAYRRLAAS